MSVFLFKRLFTFLATLAVASVLVFAVLELLPGNAAEIILGDSHEYGWDVSPFDSEEINRLILNYLQTFAQFPDAAIAETWHGVYPKLPGKTDFVQEVEKGVWIVNGLSGAGMTMSFGLASELV